MKTAYQLAREVAEKSRTKQGKYYELNVRGVDLQEGDRVLVKVVAFECKHKIADRWEEDPYVILRDADSHQRDADLSDDSDYEVYLTQVPVP